MPMTLATVSVALPAPVAHDGGTVATGIFKRPVDGPVAVRWLNLAGDGQADLVHHGGADKAVYAYSLDHYPWWCGELDRETLPHGQFGENLTIAGLDEAKVCVGDQLQIGGARFEVTQPRVPCFKLGIRLGDRDMPRRFAESLRSGVYLRVLREGSIEAGQPVEVIAEDGERIAIRALFEAYFRPNDCRALAVLEQALAVPALSDEWRRQITRRLQRRRE
ncbi:MOSC domain-containing protein [Dyella sp.]|jgi:MOSC domain-containing protein YiiM|uniref:MOSC domain-containing protein n=1 Tax=Dyella sp. TaxID=1869338 RepID=UPI002D7856B2|nr:MOSC domain-containing protein [Dyella sp.]HET6430993.1 MOSC domain-containing protein [Dyella sp.]